MKFFFIVSIALYGSVNSRQLAKSRIHSRNAQSFTALPSNLGPLEQDIVNKVVDTVLLPETSNVVEQARPAYEALSVVASSVNSDFLDVASTPMKALAAVPVVAFVLWKAFKDDDELSDGTGTPRIRTAEDKIVNRNRALTIASVSFALICAYGAANQNTALMTIAAVPLKAIAAVPVAAFLIWNAFQDNDDVTVPVKAAVKAAGSKSKSAKSTKAASTIASMKADLAGRVELTNEVNIEIEKLRKTEQKSSAALKAAEVETAQILVEVMAAGIARRNAEAQEIARLAAAVAVKDLDDLITLAEEKKANVKVGSATAASSQSVVAPLKPFYKKPSSVMAQSSSGVASDQTKVIAIQDVAAVGQARAAPSNPFYTKPASSASRPLPVDPLSKQRESPPMPPQAKSGIPGVAAPGLNRGAVAVPGVAAAGQARTAPSNPFYKKPGSSPARPLPVDPLSAPRAAPQSVPQTRASTPATSSGAGAAAASYGQARPAPKSPFYKKPASSVSRPLPVDPLSAPRAAPQSAPQVGGGGGGSSYQTGSTGAGAGAAAASYGQARSAPKSPFYKKPASSVSRPLPVDPLSRQSGQSAPQAAAGGGGGGGSSYQTGSTGAGTGAAAAAYGQRKSPFYKKPASSVSRPLPVDPLSKQRESPPMAPSGRAGVSGVAAAGQPRVSGVAAAGQPKTNPFYKKPASSASRPLPVDPLSKQRESPPMPPQGRTSIPGVAAPGQGRTSIPGVAAPGQSRGSPQAAPQSRGGAVSNQGRAAPKSPFYKKPASSSSRPLPVDPLSARSFRTVASSIDMNTFDFVMHTTLKLESTGKVAEVSAPHNSRYEIHQ